ncbi:S41 family peptidase [Streptococcus zalophi]|uniref:Peptidase S41 n=1 Tax=Streptococcus zalophi TaxID=640031 RepID=A0A934PAJ1_9STRE|nr:S41 family peptidase [Streptococcus zalophi]MBJ8350216.1 peptidase S41 [Streptococcus zalophi]
MKKTEIFEEVVRYLREDSSTKKDIKGANPDDYRSLIDDDMSEDDFLYLMHSYIASFGILSHVYFGPKKVEPNGFRLRRVDNVLYVLSANKDTNLQKGDAIVAIDDVPISTYYDKHKTFFVSPTPERQFMDWAILITRASHVTVKRDGKPHKILVEKTKLPITDSVFEWKRLTDAIVYLKMENFYDESAISQLFQDSQSAIEQAKALVIDVRTNHGGTDSLYFPLLKYALPEGKSLDDINFDDDQMEILYTKRNVALRLAQFEEILEQETTTEETRRLIESFKKELICHQNDDFVLFDDDTVFPEMTGLKWPKEIFILSDVYCASSGDNFVQMMKKFPKVTVLGRPTMGILDYSNVCRAFLGDYQLVFPTSRSLAIDFGQGMTDKGVAPDILIPFTPQHLFQDIDLEVCLKLLK